MKTSAASFPFMVLQLALAVFGLTFFLNMSVAAAQTSQPIEGCDPKVADNLQKKAQDLALLHKAIVAQIVKKPDSVLALTCFNQLAGKSAADGGSIFSGDFSQDQNWAPGIESQLDKWYDNYRQDAFGKDTGMYDNTKLTNATDCTYLQQIWDKYKTGGIEQGVPNMTAKELQSRNIPLNAGDEFRNTLNSTPAPVYNTIQKPAPKNYNASKTTCDVLKQAYGGSVQGCP